MTSVLNNSLLKKEIEKVSEVANYLWIKGWAERNGGNITVNVTEAINSSSRNLTKSIAGPFKTGIKLDNIKGMYFFCKGTNKRMRDLAVSPMDNGSLIRICEDGESYVIVADKAVIPTSELPSHLTIHNYLVGAGSPYKAVIHTHPIDLVAMSHNKAFLEKDVLSNLLWSMIPETRAFCPKGVGIVPYKIPGSVELANATLEQLKEYDVVIWEKHGVCAIGPDVLEAFDMIDTLSKSAQIYQTARNMGFIPDGMTKQQMDELKEVFKL